MADIPFIFVSVVWGEKYVERFARLALASLASPGNLGDFAGSPEHRYLVYTRKEDMPIIEASPAWKKIGSYVSAELREMAVRSEKVEERIPYWEAWLVVNLNFRNAIAEAAPIEAAISMLPPDVLCADGSLRFFRSVINSGKKVIFVSGCHTQPETIIPALTKNYLDPETGIIKISCREMVKLAMDNFHEYSRRHFWQDRYYHGTNCGNLYWEIPGEGFVGRNFAASPEYFRCNDKFLDWPEASGFELVDYILERIPDPADHYYVEDTDEAVALGLETQQPGDRDWKYSPEDYLFPPNILRAALWVSKRPTALQKEIARRKIRWHYAPITSKWEEVEKESDRVLEGILSCAELYNKHPSVASDAVAFNELLKSYDAKLKSSVSSHLESLNRVFESIAGLSQKIGITQGASSAALQDSLNAMSFAVLSDRARIYARELNVERCIETIKRAGDFNISDAVLLGRETFQIVFDAGKQSEAHMIAAKVLELLSNSKMTLEDKAIEALKFLRLSLAKKSTLENARLGKAETCIQELEECFKQDLAFTAPVALEVTKRFAAVKKYAEIVVIGSRCLEVCQSLHSNLNPLQLGALREFYCSMLVDMSIAFARLGRVDHCFEYLKEIMAHDPNRSATLIRDSMDILCEGGLQQQAIELGRRCSEFFHAQMRQA